MKFRYALLFTLLLTFTILGTEFTDLESIPNDKEIALAFVSNHCPYCIKLISWLKENKEKLNPNVRIVIVTPVSREMTQQMVDNQFDYIPAAIPLFRQFMIRGVPTTIILSKDKTMKDQIIGFNLPKLEKVLLKPKTEENTVTSKPANTTPSHPSQEQKKEESWWKRIWNKLFGK